ncbi:hypothetical protein [Bradyrhizobium sp. ARR65]|uniref:hypothetical protein n=1 Tax=Bradyrhizobium sp. ARR65 TaxID=1040989 RepID=UPI001FD982CB|nr:hypothetical protein [Bradyrhizobium sp. ARR65]
MADWKHESEILRFVGLRRLPAADQAVRVRFGFRDSQDVRLPSPDFAAHSIGMSGLDIEPKVYFGHCPSPGLDAPFSLHAGGREKDALRHGTFGSNFASHRQSETARKNSKGLGNRHLCIVGSAMSQLTGE